MRRINKQQFNNRIRHIVEHRKNPDAPVDAATLLHEEANRLAGVTLHGRGWQLCNRMQWAYRVAAARLECMTDPAMLVRYKKVKGGRR